MPPTPPELIDAIGHPLRRRILSAYVEELVGCASAGELANMLDKGIGQVAYHLKTLAACEILRPVHSGDGQGAEEAHYGWVLAVDREWLRLVLEVWAEADVSG